MGVDYSKQYRRDQLEAFFPNEIVKMAIVVLCTLAVLVFLVILPTLLELSGITGVFHEEEPANPRHTPTHIKPEWYFLATYQYLKLMPQELFGMDGKALGIFTQAVGTFMLLLLPFWFPLAPSPVRTQDWRRALAACVPLFGLFLGGALLAAFIRAKLPQPYADLLHPMFTWPPLAVISFLCAWLWARKRLIGAFHWLKLFISATFLVGFQFLAWIVVLAQALAGALTSGVAYAIGTIFFGVSSFLVVYFFVRRARDTDEHLRWPALTIFVTESLLLFLGLTLWAMWPAEGIVAEEGLTREGRGFLLSAGIIAAAVLIFYTLVYVERKAIRRYLGPFSETEKSP